MAIVDFNPDQQNQFKRPEDVYAASQAGDNGPNLPKGIDAMALAFLLLLEAASSSAKSAIIRSKQLSGNAKAQQRLDNEAAQLQWNYMPKPQIHNHTRRIATPSGKYTRWNGKFWTAKFWEHGMHYHYKKIRRPTIANQGQIDQAETKNQQVAEQRETISDKLKVLQQLAQVGETGVNSQVQDSLQSMQEGSNLMQILESLTFKALIRRPVQ